MTLYELLTLGTAVLALIVSAVSLVRTRGIAAEQLKLERVTAELAKAQLDEMSLRAQQRKLPKLNAVLTKLGQNSYLVITNTGEGSALNLNLAVLGDYNPVVADRDQLPHPELRPGARLKLIASMHLGSPARYEAVLSWTDATGERKETFWLTP